MKKVLFLSFILVFSFILSGCTTLKVVNTLPSNDDVSNVVIDNSGNSVGNQVDSTQTGKTTSTIATTTVPKKVVQKFYPEGLSPKPVTEDDSQTTSTSRPPSFSVTQELQVKLYLIDKYSPGVCYGLPGPVPEVAIQGMINDNPDLVKFLKGRYELKTDLDVYKKIKQINGIYLVSDKGSYTYEFTDGQCCTLHAYQGKITIVGANITDVILKQETQSNPC